MVDCVRVSVALWLTVKGLNIMVDCVRVTVTLCLIV